MFNLATSLKDVSIFHAFKFSRNEDDKKAGISKVIKATFSFDGMTVKEGLEKAVRQAAISWQHSNRDDYDKFTDGQELVVLVQSAGRKQVDHLAALKTEYAGADEDRRNEIIAEITGESVEA